MLEFSWKIIEYKLMYYRPDLVHDSWHKDLTISDSDYDKIEEEYIKMCRELKLTPTVTEMVGIDLTRPSCKLVLSKLSKKKEKHEV